MYRDTPECESELRMLARAHLAAGETEAAEYLLLAALESDDSPALRMSLAMIDLGRGRLRGAAHHALRAARLDSASGRPWLLLARVAVTRQRPGRATRFLHRALSSPESAEQAHALVELASIFETLKRPERSRRYLHLALRKSPGFARARVQLARLG